MTPNDGTHGPAGVQDVLRTEQISMSFGPVVALRSVDLHLPRGEILGLVGDNGAGKSTLVKILTGLYRPDGGRIYLNGEEVKFRSVRDARQHGIETVFQDLALVGEQSVYHNLFLNREQTRGGWFRSQQPGDARHREAVSGRHRSRHSLRRHTGGEAVRQENIKILLLDEPGGNGREGDVPDH